MDCNTSKTFSFDFKHIIIDEIALEGLEGIDIELLWRRLETRISNPVTEKMKRRFWDFITSSPSISFYELPQTVPYLEIKDRFKIIDEESGHLKDPDDYIDGPYEYSPVENEYGSCTNFQNRKLVDVSSLSYEEAISIYNQTLVMVASKEERWKALGAHVSESHIAALNPVHYCLLELIGRSRENGQMTIGKTNLLKIVKDSKMLFYHRKFLQTLDLVRVIIITQKIADRGVKSILLRLRRFHKSVTMTYPKIGPIHDLVNHLRRKADFSDELDEIVKKGIVAPHRNKKFQKTYSTFEFSEKEVEVEIAKKGKVVQKRRFIAISTKSDDESSASDDDTSEPVLKCQYKVGVSLLRQAYQNLKDSGLKGLTQVELAQLLGTEFYTSRSICKLLKSKGLVKEVYEDVGRQRTARYILLGSSMNIVNENYEEEWRKFNHYRDQTMLENEKRLKRKYPEEATTSSNYSMKHNLLKSKNVDLTKVVTEVKKIEGLAGYELDNISLLSTKKSLTLRQLKYANGIIKVLEDKLAIAGYQVVNNFVAAEIGEPQMDTRALKVFLQKLHTDGLIKVYKIHWPELDRSTTYICAPHLTPDHPIFRDKYEEILQKVLVAKTTRMTKKMTVGKGNKALSRYSIPRYSKVRKFHEYIFKLAYFNDTSEESELPEGFGYLHQLVPNMTVEFALGNVNLFGQINLTTAQVNETLNMKLKDVPQDIAHEIIYASTFRNSLKENLRILAFFGLIQIVNQSLNLSYDGVMYYVNRHAKIINTTGVWPRNDADLKALETEFYLGSPEDVTDFWNTVFQISINTNVAVEKREYCHIKPPVRKMDEVQLYDNGERLGDGRGPCGFDSSFYLEQTRLWRAGSIKRLRNNPKAIIKPVLIPKLQRKMKVRPKKITKKALAKEKNKERRQELSEFKIPRARGKRTPFLQSGTWSKQDDLIITLCKVAHTIMGPVTQPGAFRLKNLVAKDILSLKDPEKTQLACHTRAVSLESEKSWTYEKHRVLTEFKKRKGLAQHYEGRVKKFRGRFSANLSKYMSEARLPMLEIVYILLQISKSKSYTQETPCIATDMESFHKNFTISLPPDNRHHVWYNMPNSSDAERVLKENIILTLAMTFNKELPVNVAKKIYAIFKLYPEMMLRKAIEELRKSQTISAREKINNSKMYKLNLQDLVETSYKLSAGYYRKWMCKLNTEFLDTVADAFDLELPIDDVLGGAGLNCFCCEFHTIGLLDISTSTPPSLVSSDSFIQEDNFNVIDIEQKCKLKSGMILVKKKAGVQKIAFDHSNIEEILKSVSRNAMVIYPEKNNIEEQDEIVRFLKDRQEKGATFQEIQDFTKKDSENLVQRLLHLESKHNIKRVGLFDNRIVHVEYAKAWAMTLDRKTFLPAPWITLYGTLRHEIFFKWTNVILSKIFEYPGCSIKYLTESCELISSKSVQDVCIFLMQCECVTMKVAKLTEVDLFSEDDSFEEPTAYNPYASPESIIVFPTLTVLTKYASIKRELLFLNADEPKASTSQVNP